MPYSFVPGHFQREFNHKFNCLKDSIGPYIGRKENVVTM